MLIKASLQNEAQHNNAKRIERPAVNAAGLFDYPGNFPD
jgi:hypothetical protein